MKRRILVAHLLLAACASDPAEPRPGGVLLEFEALIDPAAGTITLQDATAFRTGLRGLSPVPVAQDGLPGVGPPDTVELVTTRTAVDFDGSGACGFPSSFCADVTVRSFYSGTLADVYAQITRITPAAGHLPLDSDPPEMGLSNTFGLWRYGNLTGEGANAARTWTFGDDGTAFRIRGVIMAEVIEEAGPWLAYIADRTPGIDELWGVRVIGGVPRAPVRLNLPLAPGEQVTSMRWTANGRYVAYQLGTSDLYFVDMTTSTPGAPRQLSGFTQPMWSPNGRYLAQLERDPAGFYRVAIVDLDLPVLAAQYAPDLIYINDGEDLLGTGWSADGDWIFGAVPRNYHWAIRMTPAGPEPMLTQAGGWEEVVSAWVAPFGASYALRVHLGASGGMIYFGAGDPYGWTAFAIAGANEQLELERSGEISYYGWPTPSDPLGYYLYNECGQLSLSDLQVVNGSHEGWFLSPDGRILAFTVFDVETFGHNLHIMRRGTSSCWDSPQPVLIDFYGCLGRTCAFGPDARTMLIHTSLIDTADPVFTELPLPGPAAGGDAAWGTTMRIFFETTASELAQVDLRAGLPGAASIVSPSFAHPNPNSPEWALSPGDEYVAVASDFASNDVHELFVADLRASSPGAPQRADAPYSGAQDVKSFGWQPALP